MPAKNRTVGAIPGYSGHVPFMRNHLIGRSYTPATIRSAECGKLIQKEDYYCALPLNNCWYDRGKCFADNQDHFNVGIAIQRSDTSSAQATRLYFLFSAHIFSPWTWLVLQHAAQHVFGKSYGNLGREIISDRQTPDKATTKELLYYEDPRPVGKILAEKHKMPGYQGYIPAKNNHVYGKTTGKASDLAAEAEKALAKRENPNAMIELVELPPQGRPDLYAQSQEKYHMDESTPLNVRVNKARVHVEFQERRPDYRLKEPIEPDIKEVMQAKHHIHGYTGHVHASQHVYGRSYGKITRDMYGHPAEPVTSEKYIEYADNRPFIDQTGELLIP